MLRKKIWASFQRIIELFLPKNLSLSSKRYGVGIRDPEKKPIQDPGSGSRVENAPDPGSGSATLAKLLTFLPVQLGISEHYMVF
jgi:hypothetical protein